MNLRSRIITLLLAILSLVTQAQVTSTFTTDDEGWIVADMSDANPQPVTYHSTGGNPGGYISTTITTCCSYYWKAPAKFMGSQCVNSYGMNFKFDLQLSTTGMINGASTVYGNVRLSGKSTTIAAVVTPEPAVTPGWTSYSVKLDETTTWHNSHMSGPVSTHAEIIAVLSNLIKIEIVAQAAFASDPEVNLDNIVLEQTVLATPPSITSFSPQLGIPLVTDVTITGSNFNSIASNNIVYFGGIKTTATSASSTQLTVKVPAGAPLAAIVVYDKITGLSASSPKPFQPQFDNNKDFGGRIIRATMAPAVSYDLDGSNGSISLGDIDGDGLNDIVFGEGGGALSLKQFSVYRNAGVTGGLTTSSFHPKVSFNLVNPYVKGFTTLADFDGDGKLDVAVSGAATFISYTSVFHNTSTPGSISFDPPLDLMGIGYSDGPITAADMDGDGRPEIISVFNNNCASGDRLFIHSNRSTLGNMDFCGPTVYGPVQTCGGSLSVADLNGDNAPEVIVEAGTVTVFENLSTKGSIVLATPFVLGTTAAGKPVVADLDRDGKVDIAWARSFTLIEIIKNIHTTGSLSLASFAPVVTITQAMRSHGRTELVCSDINGDGKLDIVMNGDTDLGILENVSTTGTLDAASFLPAIPYVIASTTNYPVSPSIADFDGDNKPDIILKTTNLPTNKLFIFRNESFHVPNITSVTPTATSTGNTVTLMGDYFKTGITSQASVRFGALPSNVTVTNNTSASTTIPVGAASGNISITTHGLTTSSKLATILFGTDGVINATSFSSSVDFVTASSRDMLAISDLDDDGKPDVVLSDGGNVRVFQNTQSVAAQPITSASLTLLTPTYATGYNCALLDIDGDGKIDLNNGYGLLKNNSTPGAISFLYGPSGEYTYAGGFNNVATGDFNKDGKTDLAVTNGTAFVQLYENQSTKEPFMNNGVHSTFNVNAINLVKPGNYGGIVSADFDGDGYDDLATTTAFTDNLTVYQNVKLYGPLTSASFATGINFTTADEPYSLTANDFDGDGKLDLAVTFYNATFISIYRNTSTSGSISFAAPVNFTVVNKGYNIASQDLDGDGLAEIVVIHRPNPGPGSFSVLQNKSTPSTFNFNTAINYKLLSPARNPEAISISDMNLDQKPDILIVCDPWGAGTHALMVFENKILSGPVISITMQPTDASVCKGATATFTTNASGTTNLTYQWQFSPNTGVYTDIVDGSNYAGSKTKSLSVITTNNFGEGRYRCRIGGDLAIAVTTNDKELFINPVPNPPTTSGKTACDASSLVLTASGGANGQYRWYTDLTGGTALPGEVNSTYTTPVVVVTTAYYATLKIGSCESERVATMATISSLTKPVLNTTRMITNGTVNLCEGEELTLTAPTGFTVYAWSTGALTQAIIINQSGIYSIVVKDAANCISPSSDPVTVKVNAYPASTISLNNDSDLKASPGESYQWYYFNDPISGATDQSFKINFLAYGVYSVDVTANGCTAHSADFTYLITGKERILASSPTKIFPSPIQDEIFIEVQASSTLTIVDILGKSVKSSVVLPGQTNRIDAIDLTPGTYTLVIKSTNTIDYFKILKHQ